MVSVLLTKTTVRAAAKVAIAQATSNTVVKPDVKLQRETSSMIACSGLAVCATTALSPCVGGTSVSAHGLQQQRRVRSPKTREAVAEYIDRGAHWSCENDGARYCHGSGLSEAPVTRAMPRNELRTAASDVI